MTNDDRQTEAVIPPSVAATAASYEYSPGVIVPAGDLLFVSGQIGRDATGQVIADPEQRPVQAGDRLEIYRPLLADPKEVRRLRAAKAAEAKARNQ